MDFGVAAFINTGTPPLTRISYNHGFLSNTVIFQPQNHVIFYLTWITFENPKMFQQNYHQLNVFHSNLLQKSFELAFDISRCCIIEFWFKYSTILNFIFERNAWLQPIINALLQFTQTCSKSGPWNPKSPILVLKYLSYSTVIL